MAVRLSALRAGRPLTSTKIPGTHSVRGWVDPRAIVRLEDLGQLKNPITLSGTELATVSQATKLPRASTIIYSQIIRMDSVLRTMVGNSHGPFQEIIPAFALGLRKQLGPSFISVSVTSSNRTQFLLNISRNYQPTTQPTGVNEFFFRSLQLYI
jgi:hypothetical protein